MLLAKRGLERGVDPFGVVAGPGEQLAEKRAALLQLVLGADVDHPAAVQHRDAVGQRERGAAVRDEQCRTSPHDLAQRVVDLRLDTRVDRAGRVVQQQDLRIRQQRPGECDPLALPAGQREALLADDRLVAVRAAPG